MQRTAIKLQWIYTGDGGGLCVLKLGTRNVSSKITPGVFGCVAYSWFQVYVPFIALHMHLDLHLELDVTFIMYLTNR